MAEFNASGRGDTRFAPLPETGHLYAGDTRTVALLESVLHNVHQGAPRVIYAATDLQEVALGHVIMTERTPVIDLRDASLARMDLTRDMLVSTSAAHYPCTRMWAEVLRNRSVGGVRPSGLLWNSRVAELAHEDSPLLADLLEGQSSEVCVFSTPGEASPAWLPLEEPSPTSRAGTGSSSSSSWQRTWAPRFTDGRGRSVSVVPAPAVLRTTPHRWSAGQSVRG